MESISIFDIFKIGVGPSSSHTLGPWKAALQFSNQLKNHQFDKIEIRLFGSLSKTGKGHATDKALILGLLGYNPELINTDKIEEILQNFKIRNNLKLNKQQFLFNPKDHIIFTNEDNPGHPNTLIFSAFHGKLKIIENTYYSIGGGFITQKGVKNKESQHKLPFPIQNAQELRDHISISGLTISEIIMRNESSIQPEQNVKAKIQELFTTMKKAVLKGCKTEGILPGGLNVVRRASVIAQKLTVQKFNSFDELALIINSKPHDFNTISQWVSCFALAVNEENAAMGRIVTAPTNGAAGVIPAVILYYYFFCKKKFKDDIEQFFLTAGELGSLFKKGATISAAMGGCQAEIGVSSAMAAGALTKVLGGNYEQVLMASEIAMEHHLGLTCDPIGGLVQIPSIERNTMGAMKAITAANLAIAGNPLNMKVNLDTIIKTMWDTAQAMDKKFKETSEGGLASNITVIYPEC